MIVAVLAPIVAALVYGGWAAYSNWGFDMSTALMAALVQGGFAFASTWLLTRAVKYLVARYTEAMLSAIKVKLVVFAQCCFLLVVIPAGLHLAVGTPNILMAMLPGLIVGNIYLGYIVHTFVSAESI